ncbi:MAG TPA: pepsin/retropepsin-like aspartic protease family protein [Candidatus Baltobacteraceae bacterium]|nr:pepsin/retropepsin-like aspartic protease family protein [Candidatus Baltobacteraceae bacterium]
MRLLAILFGALVVAAPCIARADDAASLLAKHRTYTGWRFDDPAIGRQDVTETVTEADGTPRQEIHTLRVGAIYRSDTHDLKENATYSRGFTGRVFWYADLNGFTVPIIGDPAKVALAQDMFFTDGVGELPWTVTGTQHKWNADYTVVRVKQDSSAPIDLYVDPATGAYAGATLDPGGPHERTLHVLAYEDLPGGKRVISKWQVDGSKRTTTVTKISTSATVTNDDLHPPAPTASWQFVNPQPFPIVLTKTRIIVKAKINGVEGRFLLDSGAADIFISGGFARRAGLKPIGHSVAYSLYGSQKTDVGIASSIDVGGNTLNNVTLYFGQRDFDDSAPDGLLGFGFLAGAFITIDFEHSTMQVQDPSSVDVANAAGVHIAVDLNSGQPVTPMSVQQKTVTVNAMLDTGSPRVILIDKRLVFDYGLHMTAAGVLGGCGLLDNMTLGPIVYDHPNACLVDYSTDLHSALLGYDFLKGLSKLEFDYGRAGMILVPRANTAKN